MHHPLRLAAVTLGTTLALPSSAMAQWTITNLHPAGAESSAASSVFDGQQVGSAMYNGVTRATRWSGTAASAVDLHPSGSSYSSATSVGVGAGRQAGWGYLADIVGQRALHWNGSTGTVIDITPDEATSASVAGSDSQSLVGFANFGAPRAILWTDADPATFVTLHPPTNPTVSYATAIGDGQQVGWVVTSGGSTKACVWSGTASSYIDLDPSLSTHSAAFGVGGGQQVGFANVSGQFRASLWSGSAASWVNLNPELATTSAANAVWQGQVVGVANIGGVNHASLWLDSAASWLDLHAQLPTDFSSSVATDIWGDDQNTYVVGYAFNTTTDRGEAILWTKPSCLASSTPDLDCDGQIGGADLAIMLGAWETSGADLNRDGTTDGADLAILLGAWR